MTRHQKRIPLIGRTRGVSTLEVMVGLSLAVVVFAGIHTSYRAQAYALHTHSRSFGLQDLTRGALDLMAREVRMAGYDPSGLALPAAPGPACPGVSQGLTEATATRLHILADLSGDGTTLGPAEDVIYELDPSLNEILRTDSGGTEVLADNAATDGLLFRYFDMSDPPVELVPAPSLSAGQRDCVGIVRLVVRLRTPNPDPTISSDLTSEASSQVAIRSRAVVNF